MEKDNCQHEALTDTGVGYTYCPACNQSWNYPPPPPLSVDEAAESYAYRHGKDEFSVIQNKEYRAFKAGADYAQSTKAVETQQGWVDVKTETIPEAGKWVACLNMSDSGFINWVAKGRMNNSKTWNVKGAIGMTFQNATPTHWMPLPEPTTQTNN